MAIPMSLVLVFAPELLHVWLGTQYETQAATALRILAVGVFANSLANPLFVVLYAKDRPDLPAKFHLIELMIHIPLTIFLIRQFGIAGAAGAWTTRVTLDMCLLLWAAARASKTTVLEVAGGRVPQEALSILVLLGGLLASRYLVLISSVAGAAAAVAVIAVFAVTSWSWILGEPERIAIRRTVRSYLKPFEERSAPESFH
jgi:O-antigen/teichoic acid export membrane protein